MGYKGTNEKRPNTMKQRAGRWLAERVLSFSYLKNSFLFTMYIQVQRNKCSGAVIEARWIQTCQFDENMRNLLLGFPFRLRWSGLVWQNVHLSLFTNLFTRSRVSLQQAALHFTSLPCSAWQAFKHHQVSVHHVTDQVQPDMIYKHYGS